MWSDQTRSAGKLPFAFDLMTDFPHPHPGFETIERIMPFIHLEKQILPFSFKGQFSRILIKSFIRHSELPSSVLRQSVHTGPGSGFTRYCEHSRSLTPKNIPIDLQRLQYPLNSENLLFARFRSARSSLQQHRLFLAKKKTKLTLVLISLG